jgi:hypothetical protein
MAQAKIPNPLERRHLIEKELTAERALALAEAYLEEDRAEEAVVFLIKADAQDRLDALQEQAVDSGNVFVIREISRMRGAELPAAVWERVAQNARAAGKDHYADAAERQAQRTDD